MSGQGCVTGFAGRHTPGELTLTSAYLFGAGGGVEGASVFLPTLFFQQKEMWWGCPFSLAPCVFPRACGPREKGAKAHLFPFLLGKMGWVENPHSAPLQ